MIFASNKTAFVAISSLALLFGFAASAQTCYFPDGKTVSPDDVPCNSSAPFSACCNADNLCMDNGLCLFSGVMSRGSCTDPEWREGSGCANFCQTEGMSGGITLWQCGFYGSNFSCEPGSCDEASTFTVAGGNAVVLRESQLLPLGIDTALSIGANDVLHYSGTASSTASATGAATSSSSSSSSSSTSDDKQFTAADMAGVGVGVGAPLAIALGGMIILFLRQRKQLKQSQHAYSPMQQRPNWQQLLSQSDLPPQPRHGLPDYQSPRAQKSAGTYIEMDPSNVVSELDVNRRVLELPSMLR